MERIRRDRLLAPGSPPRYAQAVSPRPMLLLLGMLLLSGCPSGRNPPTLPGDLRFHRVLRLSPYEWRAREARPSSGRPATLYIPHRAVLALDGPHGTMAVLRFHLPRTQRSIAAAWLHLAPWSATLTTVHLDVYWGCARDASSLPMLRRTAASATLDPATPGAPISFDVASAARRAHREGCDLALGVRTEDAARLPGPGASDVTLRPVLWLVLGP